MEVNLKYPVITISREYAAGGRTVAAALSQRLGIPYYDKDFVKETAARSGYSVEDINREGEDMSVSSKLMNSFLNNALSYQSSFDGINHAQREVILQLSKSPCIIVGRCADHVLTEAGVPAFKVFLFADAEHKLKRAAELEHNDNVAELKKIMEKKDANRETYYRQYTGKDIGSYKNYNICLDTGMIGMDKCIDIIVDLVTD